MRLHIWVCVQDFPPKKMLSSHFSLAEGEVRLRNIPDDDILKTQPAICTKNFRCKRERILIENLFIFGDFCVDLMKKLFVNWRWKLKTNVCSVRKSFPG